MWQAAAAAAFCHFLRRMQSLPMPLLVSLGNLPALTNKGNVQGFVVFIFCGGVCNNSKPVLP
jgi:hypothetical protein